MKVHLMVQADCAVPWGRGVSPGSHGHRQAWTRRICISLWCREDKNRQAALSSRQLYPVCARTVVFLRRFLCCAIPILADLT